MKKFISFVMAAAMVASLVPATAFAKGEVTARAKVVDAISSTKDEAKENVGWITENSTWVEKVPELQLTITSTDYRDTEAGADPTVDVTLSLDNAVFAKKNAKAKVEGVDDLLELVKIIYDSDRGSSSVTKWTDNPSGNDFKSPAGKIVVQNPSGATANMEKRATFTDGEVADFL